MNNIITAIAQRIRDEHRKHPDIDWEYIAASKIYQSFIDDGNYTQDKTEPQFFGNGMKNSDMLITEDDVVKGLLKYHNKLYGDDTDTLFDTTNKSEKNVSNIIHNSDTEPSVKIKDVGFSSMKYKCVISNDYFKKDEVIELLCLKPIGEWKYWETSCSSGIKQLPVNELKSMLDKGELINLKHNESDTVHNDELSDSKNDIFDISETEYINVDIKINVPYICTSTETSFKCGERIVFDHNLSMGSRIIRVCGKETGDFYVDVDLIASYIYNGIFIPEYIYGEDNNIDSAISLYLNTDKKECIDPMDKIIIDTEVYYTCLKDNKWFKKNNQIGFKKIPELPDMMEVNIINGNRFFLKSCAIKQMIANREIDTPF